MNFVLEKQAEPDILFFSSQIKKAHMNITLTPSPKAFSIFPQFYLRVYDIIREEIAYIQFIQCSSFLVLKIDQI